MTASTPSPLSNRHARIAYTHCAKYATYTSLSHISQVGLKFSARLHAAHIANTRYDISFSVSRSTFVFMHASLGAAAKELPFLLHAAASAPAPLSAPTASMVTIGSGSGSSGLRWRNAQLNAEQRAAVAAVVGGSYVPQPYLIWGPPGTGKTSTLVEAALQVGREILP